MPAATGAAPPIRAWSTRLGLPECPVGAHLDADGPVEINMWHPYTAETAQAMEDVGAAFNAAQDDIVVTVEAQGDYGELLAKYRESINFDDLPTVAITDAGTFATWSTRAPCCRPSRAWRRRRTSSPTSTSWFGSSSRSTGRCGRPR